MRAVVLIVPGPIQTPTGGYLYDRRMADGLRKLGWSVDVRELEDSFPHPTAAALAHASDLLKSFADGARVLVDGLALGAMPEAIEREASRLRIVALVHLPLAADISVDAATAALLEASERRALGAVNLIVVTGSATLPMLARYGISRDKIVVVEPGTEAAPLARGSGGQQIELLTVATLNPIKGYELLIEALSRVPLDNWRLACAGSVSRHTATADRVRAAIRKWNLDDRITLVGELSTARLHECYDRADVFVLATRQETFGMAVSEALARGLPVVSTTTGAIPTLVGADAGLLVPPDDIGALAGALTRVIGDEALRARLAEGARRVRTTLRTWEQSCGDMAAALERV